MLFSFTSSRAKGNLFQKKYVQKKHFVSEEENNCEEEINSKPQDRTLISIGADMSVNQW